jgi:hypothetical protein
MRTHQSLAGISFSLSWCSRELSCNARRNVLPGCLWNKREHRAHEVDRVLKTSSVQKRLAQAFPLDLEFVSLDVVVMENARGVRHVTTPSPQSSNGKVSAWFH